MLDSTRGILYPDLLPRFHRLAPTPACAELVTHVWFSEWEVPDGAYSPQTTIAFPTANLIVEHTHVGFAGATTKATTQDLRGTGWAVGLLLKPAVVPALVADPRTRVDTYEPYPAPDLFEAVTQAMTMRAADRLERARDAACDWLAGRATTVGPLGLEANRVVAALSDDPALLTLADAAAALHLSERSLQRLTMASVGLSPVAIIRRRRLHEAAARLRRDPNVPLSELAACVGYSDHAHLTRDFATVLGFTPSSYRATS